MRFGPLLHDGGVTFRLWAPAARTVSLILDKPRQMQNRDGWFTLDVAQAGQGAQYSFEIDGELRVPDPASRFQPRDVHGPSEVIDHQHNWRCSSWIGRPWHESVILELHVGTFTPAGTFRAVIDKLDHLVDVGITAIELMPVSDFPGRWNWGYDGVLPFAPDSSYGRPEDLKSLIDAAHQRGLMVLLDVVYNHLGPEGNCLGRLAPRVFSSAQTPWGAAIDYRVPEVRAFVIENAVGWVRDYRFDGLRLDAADAIVVPGTPHILHDISVAIGAVARESGRHIHLVLENDSNNASWLVLKEEESPPRGHYRAQWNDDYHHAWHVLLTGEQHRYYRDYADPGRHIARALREGFSYQGEPSRHRGGAKRGEPSKRLPPLAFVNFLQNHDQIGNRRRGERLTTIANPRALEAALELLLLAPFPALLFMGEEWGATSPFPFFCDFKGALADAVRDGRKTGFGEAYSQSSNGILDPLEQATRDAAVLNWGELQGCGAERLALTRALLKVRSEHVVPLMPQLRLFDAKSEYIDGVISAQWRAGQKTLALVANLQDAASLVPACRKIKRTIWGKADTAELAGWAVVAGFGEMIAPG